MVSITMETLHALCHEKIHLRFKLIEKKGQECLMNALHPDENYSAALLVQIAQF